MEEGGHMLYILVGDLDEIKLEKIISLHKDRCDM